MFYFSVKVEQYPNMYNLSNGQTNSSLLVNPIFLKSKVLVEDNLIATLSRKPPLVSSSQSRAPAPVHTLVAPLKGGGARGAGNSDCVVSGVREIWLP